MLVVDHAAHQRPAIHDMLADDPKVKVVGVSTSAESAKRKYQQLDVDVVVMELGIPQVKAAQLMSELRAAKPDKKVNMIAVVARDGNGLAQARDAKPDATIRIPACMDELTVSQQKEACKSLLLKVKAMDMQQSPKVPGQRGESNGSRKAGSSMLKTFNRVLAIGSSTGGPQALSTVIGALPRNLDYPVFITQHMPPMFTKQLAMRLARESGHDVVEAVDGMEIVPGRMYIAPGDYHMVLEGEKASPTISLIQTPPENHCRPAVDVMFRSLASYYRSKILGVVLTGMGSDGALGAADLRKQGAYVIAQDEATSVVWGMPGATVAAGNYDVELPLEEIASHITTRSRQPSRR